MFGTLLKKQMTEIFRGYFYDAKKNKKRSTTSTVMFILLYLVVMVGILGGIFTYLSVTLCGPFAMLHMSWLYFLMMSLIAIALGAFGSVFNTYSGLYMSKDNDLLLSLPIPVRSILASRLASVYLLGLMYSAVVIVPAVIVYWVVVPVTFVAVIGCILLVLFVSVIVLILSCALGWCVAKISMKLKNKSFLTVFVSLVFFAAYYFVFYKAQSVIEEILLHAETYGKKVKASVYPLYLFGRVGEGDVLAIIVCAVVIFGICALTFWLLSRSFLSIVTASGKTARVAYKEKKIKSKNMFQAMLAKEFGRFTASPTYMLNCGLGAIFLLVLGVVLVVKGNAFTKMMMQIFGTGGGNGIPVVIVVTVICMIASMNDMVVPSVSLEGKNIWIAQSLPVQPWDALRAKLMVQILVTGIPVLFCDICMCIVLQAGFWELLLGVVVSVLFVLFMALFGLMLGLKMPNLTWTNELAPIKQSISVMIEMFGGWGFSLVIGGVYITVGWHMGAALYLVILTIVLIAVSVLLLMWLKKKGTEIFRWL